MGEWGFVFDERRRMSNFRLIVIMCYNRAVYYIVPQIIYTYRKEKKKTIHGDKNNINNIFF